MADIICVLIDNFKNLCLENLDLIFKSLLQVFLSTNKRRKSIKTRVNKLQNNVFKNWCIEKRNAYGMAIFDAMHIKYRK